MNASARFGAAAGGALLALTLLVGVPSAGAAPKDREAPETPEAFEFTCTEATDADAPEEAGSHPSGKDRAEESGSSGTQGRSNSDPDGGSNGGSDKPGCERGGAWADDDDNDGNNGCGNDADFEDDNNGNCGKGRRQAPADEPVEGFGVPEDEVPAEEPAPAAVDEEPEVAEPAPAPEPVDEEPEAPIVWADEDPVNDPDPDDEYGDDPAEPIVFEDPADEPAAGEPVTEEPSMTLAADYDMARTGGLFAAGLLLAVAVLRRGSRLIVAFARRRLSD